jgi:DNA-binding XRE family transcriptional regulator
MSTIPPNTSALGSVPSPAAFRRIPRKIQNHLRTLRSQRGLTLQQVSEGTGLSISTLHAIENEQEREATLATAFKLARFYGLSVEKIWQPLFEQICHEADENQPWALRAPAANAARK